MSARFFEAASHAAIYAKFRPSPPVSLTEAVLNFLSVKINRSNWHCAVDVGCGSGQSTVVYADHFTEVNGTDVSPAQIEIAVKNNIRKNIKYSVCEAEKLPFPFSSVQLVTSCQACHWFDMNCFYSAADRILVPGGVVALSGYTLPRIIKHPNSKQLTAIIDDLYGKTLAGCWGEGRTLVDEAYTNEKFRMPYPGSVREESHACPQNVTLAELLGYFTSWSGFQNYVNRHGQQRGSEIVQEIQERFLAELDCAEAAPEDVFVDISYPYFLMMGRKPTPEH